MFALSPDAAQPCPADPRHAQIARARSLAFGEQALAGMPPATLPAPCRHRALAVALLAALPGGRPPPGRARGLRSTGAACAAPGT